MRYFHTLQVVEPSGKSRFQEVRHEDDISFFPPQIKTQGGAAYNNRYGISSLGRYVFGSEISYNKPPPRLPGLACLIAQSHKKSWDIEFQKIMDHEFQKIVGH